MKVKLTGNLKKEILDAVEAAKKPVMQRALDALVASTPIDTGNARAGWRIEDNKKIVNDVDYISELNEGTSKQAPSFFIEKTLMAQGLKPKGAIVK
jgi:hypothetical protein